jgi:hypothetical protein
MSLTRFGQLVIGPPGSGKTTYVKAMSDLLRRLNRKIAIVNLGKFFKKILVKGTVPRAVLGLVFNFLDVPPNIRSHLHPVNAGLRWLNYVSCLFLSFPIITSGV